MKSIPDFDNKMDRMDRVYLRVHAKQIESRDRLLAYGNLAEVVIEDWGRGIDSDCSGRY